MRVVNCTKVAKTMIISNEQDGDDDDDGGKGDGDGDGDGAQDELSASVKSVNVK